MSVNVDELIKSFEASRKAGLSPRTQSQQLDMAKYILTHADIDYKNLANVQAQAAKRDSSGPSVVSRIFDILSRPNYAVANYFKNDLDSDPTNDNALENIWRGLAGYDKTTFSDVIATVNKEMGGKEADLNPIGQYGGGFALDVALDPTTYIGVGAIKAIGKALGIGAKADKIAELPAKAINLKINEIPTSLSTLPEKASHFNLATAPSDLNLAQPAKSLEGYAPKVTDVDLPGLKFTPDASKSLESINAVSKNMARQRFKTEFTASLKDKLPDATPDELKAKVAEWMDEYFPKARSAKYKEQTPGFPEFTPTPPVAQGVVKADEILSKLQSGDPATIAEQSFNIAHREKVLSELGEAGATESAQAIKYADGYADRILSKPNKFPAKTGKKPAVFNPAQQANLAETFMRIQRQTKGNLNAFRMIRAAEDHLISRGYHPTFWDGTNVRLSDVILEMAGSAKDIPDITKTYLTKVITDFKNSHKPSKNADFRIAQTIENLRAHNAVNEAPLISSVVDESSKVASIADRALSNPKYKQFVETIKKQAEDNLNTIGASQSGIAAARSLIKTLDGNTTPPLATTQNKSYYIQSYMKGEQRLWQPVQHAQTQAIASVVGTPIAQAAKAIGDSNKAESFFLSRFATWYGQKDLRPEVLIRTSTAAANAGSRARVWNSIAKQYTPNELEDGFRFAQSRIPMGASTDKIEKVGQIFQKAMQNLFDSTGLTKAALQGSTVATRSGMLLNDINTQLRLVKAPFQFDNGRWIDSQGKLVDYSQGTDWLKSWERVDIKDPLEFMWKMETAVEQLMHKYAYLDEVAARWGSNVKSREFNTPIDFAVGSSRNSGYEVSEGYARATKSKTSPRAVKPKQQKPTQHRLDGIYFPAEIASQIKKSLETWDQIYDPKSDLVKLLDRVTRAWKSGVTIYAPSHHIRNMIGDVYLSWMAGVNNPGVYSKAAKVIWSQKDRYKDLETVENLVGRDALSRSLTRPGDVVLTTRGGRKLTAEQIYIAAHNTGLLPHTNVIEELFGEPLLKVQPFKGKVRDFVRGTAENREHFVRIAHFIDILEKSREKNLDTLFKEASKVVRKWHPDGSDLTDFERNVIRRIMPFYSWTRKSIPLLVEGAVTNPGKTIVYPKFMQALQGMMGIDSPSRTEPFPNDQLFPDWIKEKGIGPILRHGLTEEGIPGLLTDASRSIPGFTGEDSGYSVVNPSNPFIDMVAQFAGMGNPSDPIKGIGQMASPLFKIPSEVIHGETLSGAPIEPGRYIAENIPIAAMLSRVSGIGAFGPTQKGQEEGFNTEALVNLLTALNLQGTGPYIKTAEFQERDRRREARGQ